MVKNRVRYIDTSLLFLGLALILSLTEPSFGQGIQMTPEYQQSRQLLSQGNYEGAISILQPLLGQSNYSATARIEIGNVRQRQAEAEMSQALNHFNEAANYFFEGIEKGGLKGPEAPKVLYDLGRIYEERLNDFVKAAEMYNRLVSGYPTFLSIDKAVYHLAACQEKLGKISEAAASYREIVSKYPYSAFFQVAQNRMKNLSPGTDQGKAAIEAQEGIVDEAKGDIQSAQASMDLAAMLAKQGDYKKAVESYRKVISDAPNSDLARDAYKRMAALQDEKEKDYKGAAATLEEMTQKFPDAPGADQNLFRLGRIYEQDMQEYKTRVVDGQVRYRKDDENTRKALDYYNKVTEKYPDADVSADAFLRKGEIYMKQLKDPEEAKKEYQEFLKRFPDHPEADKIREKLDKLDEYNE